MKTEQKILMVGIIGCGTVVQTMYANTFPVLPNVKVRSVYDLNTKNAQKAAELFQAEIQSPQEMKQNVDAVVIATPPHTHFQLVSETLSEGKTVICEKPFVGKRADAEALVKLASEKRAKLYVAHFRRMFPHLQLVRSLTATGIFGAVTGMNIIEGGRFSWDAQSGYVMNDPFGGVLFDTGSHTIDMALFAAMLDQGKFAVTINTVTRDKQEPSHEIQSSFTFESEQGRGKGKVHLSRYQVLANIITIEYEHGAIQFSPGLSHRIRLSGAHGTSIIFPEFALANYAEPFAEQYRSIFSGQNAEIFSAERFCNLSFLLESIANG